MATSDLPAWGTAQPARPAPQGSQVPLWLIGLAVVVMLAMAAVVGYVFLVPHEKAASPYPAQWDPRIAPYAKTAERLRGLYFLHPVAVRFETGRDFEKGVTADSSKVSAKERKEIDQYTGMLRAFGLVQGKVDLFGSSNEAKGAGTLAYYSYATRSITVRGTSTITPSMRSTLVHELTHALQDQRFHTGALAEKAARTSATDGRSAVLEALVEGDARRVERLYAESLTARQRAVVQGSQRREEHDAAPRLSKVPPILLTQMAAPYELGQGLVELVAQRDGNAGIDRLLRHVPSSDTVLLDPFQALEDKVPTARTVAKPSLDHGDEKFTSGSLGAVWWYFVLGERVPRPTALAAADAWGGDHFVAYQHAGRSCVRTTYVGRTRAGTDSMYAALRQWTRGVPSTAKVTSDGRVVRLQTCDPGTSAHVGRDTSAEALQLVSLRTSLSLGLLRRHTPAWFTRCYVDRSVRAFPARDLADPHFGSHDPAVLARLRGIAAGCRS